MKRIAIPMTLLALVAALAIAGCGGGDSSGGAYGGKGGASGGETTAATAAPNPEEGTTFVSVAAVPELGRVLVDSNGLTLYDFHKDQGTESSCYGGCAEVWPPLLSEGEPHASNGAQAGLLGTTGRKDGTTQVTYAGHPLYTYVEDKGPGDATGNDVDSFGAEWYALTPSGAEPEDNGGGASPPPTSY
jgi:predicted lipoprotein with Yx(FWY)xxD motif